jgi:hypothetical protein
VRATAAADVSSVSTVTCTLTIGSTSEVRRGTPLTMGGEITLTFAASGTSTGTVTLGCTGQTTVHRLTIQAVTVSGTTP